MKKKFPPAKRVVSKAKQVRRPVIAKNPPPVLPRPFPVVGLGASAGGLEALEQFLKNVPAQSGLAFVVMQHLDPTYRGIMAELLHLRERSVGIVLSGMGTDGTVGLRSIKELEAGCAHN